MVVSSSPGSGNISVRESLCAAALLGALLLFVYMDTAWSMIAIWLRSDTFAHGFLVLPISLCLVWMQREQLRGVKPVPAALVSLLLIPSGVAWLMAWLVEVSVVQQLALVAMIIAGAWAVLGHELSRLMVFPLFFLFFAVPVGEGLIAPMMEFTATSTVWLIQVFGIPVYREGLNFFLPSGPWSVVEACSGVRYIIASVTVGTLYAYLTYRTWPRRLLFVAVSAVVPVFANTLRAFIIVMIGHASDMALATGVDHLVYGWVFFGLVIMLLFWLGSFFRQDDEPQLSQREVQARSGAGGSRWQLAVTMIAVIALASIGPLLVQALGPESRAQADFRLTLPQPAGDWYSPAAGQWQWHPPSRVAGSSSGWFGHGEKLVQLTVQYPDGSEPGADVIGSSGFFVPRDSGSRLVERASREVVLQGDRLSLTEARIESGQGELLLAWSWYAIGDIRTANGYVAKLAQLQARFSDPGLQVLRIVITSRLHSIEESRALLQRFIEDNASVLSLNASMNEDGLTLGKQQPD